MVEHTFHDDPKAYELAVLNQRERDRELIERGVRAGIDEAAERAWACDAKYIRALDVAAIVDKVVEEAKDAV